MEWIDFKENPPTEGREYLVFDAFFGRQVSRWNNTKGYWNSYANVTHYSELINIPK